MMKGIRSYQSFQAPMVLNCRAKALVDRNRRVNEQPPFFKRITVIREVTGPSSLINCLVAIQRSGAKFTSKVSIVA
jgi:hypothetical protein